MKNLKKSHFTLGLIIVLLVFILSFQRKEQNDSKIIGMQVGVVVSDLAKSLDFYTNVIGMTKVSTYHGSAEVITEAGLTDGKALDIINLKLNGEPGEPEYKITKIQDVKSPPLSNSFTPGLRYISIFVNDLDPYLERIKARNIKLLSKKNPLTAPEGYKVIVLQDPDGALLELISFPKE
jgi:catechol 2,3-dioxygenase-like lactoylglutathione lyase family enzyme